MNRRWQGTFPFIGVVRFFMLDELSSLQINSHQPVQVGRSKSSVIDSSSSPLFFKEGQGEDLETGFPAKIPLNPPFQRGTFEKALSGHGLPAARSSALLFLPS